MKDFQQLVNNQVITKLHIDKEKLDEIGGYEVEPGVKELIRNEIITQPGMVEWVKNWWDHPGSEKAEIKLIDKEGLEYTIEDYLEHYDQDPDIKGQIEGVLVRLKEIEFVVSKLHKELSWFEADKLSELKGVTNTFEQWAALGDMLGLDNTEAIDAALNAQTTLAVDDPEEYATQFCKRVSAPHGYVGYLPSEGELWTAYNNIETIDKLLKLIGASGSNIGDVWLSSTQHGKDEAWAMNFKTGDAKVVNKTTKIHVKPFFKPSPTMKSTKSIDSGKDTIKSQENTVKTETITVTQEPKKTTATKTKPSTQKA